MIILSDPTGHLSVFPKFYDLHGLKRIRVQTIEPRFWRSILPAAELRAPDTDLSAGTNTLQKVFLIVYVSNGKN